MSISCLLLTPFSAHDLKLQEHLKDLLSNVGITVMHATDLPLGVSLFHGLRDLMERADVLIADVSDLNPNVVYEIGLAHGLGLPVILLADQASEIPMSLSSLQLLRYTKDKLVDEDFTSKLLSRVYESADLSGPSSSYRASILEKDRVGTLLHNPFDYLSAEMFQDTTTLEQLFVSPPYQKRVTGPETVVLVGPRGCGKTMLLQVMRLQKQTGLGSPITDRLAGFYVNFNQAFNFLGDRKTILANPENAIIYFNLLFLNSVLNETLMLLRVGRIKRGDEANILSAVNLTIGSPKDHPDSIQDVSKRIMRWTDLIRGGNSFEGDSGTPLSSVRFLEDLATNLIKYTETFAKQRIAFLLDDFAVDWLPKEISETLNKIIFNRCQHYSFKIATIPGRQTFSLGESPEAQAGRDYVMVNTSTDVSFTNINSRVRFLKEILDKRLALAGWPVNASDLLSRKYSARERIDYSGIVGLSRLCSGDYANIIEICSRMTTGSVPAETPIPREIQNRIIREHSRELITSLRSGLEWGEYVVEFLGSMMGFLRKRLSQGKYEPLGKMTRQSIISGFLIDNVNALSPPAQDRLLLLIRTGILLSTKGTIREQRFAIRRLLFPAFELPIYGINDYITLDAYSSEFLLDRPREFWQYRMDKLYPATIKKLSLFNDE